MSTNPFRSGYEPARGFPTRTVGLRIALLMAVAGVFTCDGTAGPKNQAPQAAGRIPDQVVQVDSTAVLDLRADFSDPEGDTLTYAASSGAPATATVTVSGSALSVTGLAAGEAMVTVTARDPDGLAATQSFAVNVTNRAPVIADTIPDGEVFVDSLLVFDAAVYFADPDGDELTYTAVSSDTTRATAAVSGSMVTVTGMAVGSTTVTVTARDPDGLQVAQSFSVTVPNQAPVAVGTINDRAVEAGRSFEVDMEDHFSDPDGDALDHAATSSDPTRATAEVSGSVVTVTGVAGGSATILVTALDSAGLSAEHRFGVTVPNQAPQSLAAIEDQAVAKDGSTTLYLSPYFSDPDGDDLTYSAGSSDQSIATVSVSGATLTLTGIRPGTVTVTATVSDPAELSVTGSFELQVVEGNLPPRAVGKIGDPALETGDTLSIDVSSSFMDPEGESLSFTASSSRQATATVALSGSTLAVTAVAEGTATIRVTARDPSNLSAVQRFDVTVGEAMTVSDLVVTAASANPDILGPGESFSLKARVHNRGPGGASSVTTLRYYRSTDENISAGDMEVGTDGVPVLGPSGNSAQSLDLTASSSVGTYYYGACADSVGNESESNNNCSGSVTVRVTTSNRAPRAVGTISGKRLDPGDSVAVDVDPYFSDPDGDSLTYTAVSSNPAAASVALSGSSVTATAVAVGTATITVTATDPDGLTANQRFAVTVQAPGQSDLVVQPPRANPNSLGPGEILRLSVVVQNQGTGDASSGTTLRYYSSLDATISAADYQVGTDTVPELGASETSAQSIALAAPSADGTYYYGACADAAGNESSTDNNCSNAVEVEVVVPNQSPRAVGTISNRSVGVGNSVSVEVESYFTDPDNDDLTYTATSGSTTLVTVTVSGSSVELTGVAAGQTTIIVRATDPGNLSATQNFTVTVAEGNLPPTLDVPIADFDADPDGVVYIFTLTEYFSDPDGDDLTWSVSSSNTNVASPKILVDTLDLTTGQPGRADIIVTATDPDGLSAADTFTVTVTTGVNQAPRVDVPIADFDAVPDGVVYILTLTEYFSDPDGDDLSWSVSSSNTNVVSPKILVDTLDMTTGQPGRADIIVTATDPDGLSAADTFTVTVTTGVNQAPTVDVPIADFDAVPDGVVYILTLTEYFSDPDGDDLTWSVSSSNTNVVSPKILVDTLDMTTGETGRADIIVTATDPDGLSAADTFTVTVTTGVNQAPTVDVPIADFDAVPDGVVYILTLTEYFSDPDGDDLSWSVSSSNTNVVSPKILVDTLDMTTGETGRADIIVTATDPDGLSAADTFTVTVTTGVNQAPTVDVPIADFDAVPDGVVYILTLTEYFSDPDGDDLSWSVSSSNTNVVSPKILVDTLDMTTGETGRADIIVTATDPDGLFAADTFTVTVTAVNRAPTVDTYFDDLDAGLSEVYSFTLTEYFSDPDGDDLTWAALTTNADVASLEIVADTLRVSTIALGSASVAVIATDPDGLSASDVFLVSVTDPASTSRLNGTQSVFANEVMTPTISASETRPFSAITVPVSAPPSSRRGCASRHGW